MASDTQQTLVSLFHERVAQDAAKPALGIKREGQYRWTSWSELDEGVRLMSARLRAAGLQPGDRLVLVSENRYEWIVCDLAVHLAGGVHVAVHSSLAGTQIAYQIRDSGARLVVVAGAEQARKLAAIDQELPPGVQYLSFDRVNEKIAGRPVVELLQLSLDTTVSARRMDHQATAADLATILYTSGTTGEPKGVMLSHGNLASNALACLAAFRQAADETRLCWLPLSHIYARTSDLYTWIASGSQMALAESRDTLLADCAAVRPTFINGVPYLYEKVARHLQESGQGDKPGTLSGLLGGRMKVCCAGGAALPDHAAEFFARQGILLVQGYGMTEASPVITTGTPEAHRLGTVGRPIPGVDVQIADDGEILTRGPHVMLGYWNKPEETAAALAGGWLHTGDLGRLEDGFLRIIGRKKDLIITAAGKNIAPAFLEGLLTADPLVAQALVIGEGRNYLTALIVPDPDHLRAEIIRRRIPVTSPAEALAHPDVHALYEELICRRLAGVSRDEQVRKFALLDRGFTIDSDELTPTLKLRRGIIQEHFAETIDRLYQDPPTRCKPSN